MAFWGVEVKPGKPFTHSSNKENGRLRISQATLGIGSALKKSLVQCNVGNKSPVLLCVLMPDKTESCHLDLEFEEAEDVVFSVIGPRSVYLTGYYVSNGRLHTVNSDTESFGEDIGNSEESDRCSDEDEYEDSFINDDEPEVLPPSPVSSDGVDMDTEEDEKQKGRKGNHKRLKKKYQVIESDDGTSLEGSIDEDNCPLSEFKIKKSVETMSSRAAEKKEMLKVETCGETENATNDCRKSKEEPHSMNLNHKTESEVGAVNFEKRKKKRKERSRDVKILEADDVNHKDFEDEQTKDKFGNMENHKKKKPTDMEADSRPAVIGAENSPKSKKRRKELEREFVGGNDPEGEAVKGEQCKQEVGFSHNMGTDVVATTEENQLFGSHKNNEINTDVASNGCLSEQKSKTKKKKSKTQRKDGNSEMVVPIEENLDNCKDKLFPVFENKEVDASNARTLSNGLIIKELAKGEPNGKIAAPGKKVKVYYTAMLKENGHVFDSNIGKSPYKFRLGDEEIIDGWNLGLDGMHVGDKRRLIIPPSMGYGNQGTGENVPPNSWLVYDVELVGVRR